MTVSVTLWVPRWIHYRSDEVARIIDPEDVTLLKTDPARLLSATNGASATLLVFDRDRYGSLRENAISGAASIQVNPASAFRALKWVEIELDSPGAVSENYIESIDPDDGTLTLQAPGLAGAASRGARIRTRLLQVAMTGYGTPAVGDASWGFWGLIPKSLDARPGAKLRLEMPFVGAAGGGLDRYFGSDAEVIEESL